jgi:ribosomal protein RSM22 (predicted rRNA methylase)
VAAGVRQLSMGLTRDRALAGARYMDDKKLLGAYLLFYWPTSYAQARHVLGELGKRPGSVLDLGSGPAPMAFAALDAGASSATAADRSASALTLARALAVEAETGLSTRQWEAKTNRPPEGQFDTIIGGHLWNELFLSGEAPLPKRLALAEAALSCVRPGGSLVLIEPALRDTSRALLELRDALVRKGFAIRAPCLFRGDCPALEKASDWCHAERNWQMPRAVADIARAAGLHKEALKMSYLVVAPANEAWPPLPEGRLFRIVSEPLAGKGRALYMGCGPEGRMGIALQDKHQTQGNAAFKTLQRGDVIDIGETETKGDGLSLGQESRVEVVTKAGRPIR